MAGGWIDGSQNQASGCRLAAAAFAHQAQGLALMHAEIYTVNRFDVAYGARKEAALDGKVLLEVLNLQQSWFAIGRAIAACRRLLLYRAACNADLFAAGQLCA